MARRDCAPCSARGKMRGRFNPMPRGRRKEWRVFFPRGQSRDYYSESDANAAIEKHGDPTQPNYGCRKQRLST